MRITTRLATAGEAGFLSMPAMRHPADHYTADGRLDQAMVRRELADTPGIQMSSNDDSDTLSFAVELLDRMKRCLEGHMQRHPETKEAERGPDAPRSAAQRRFDKGRTTFVRVDIRRNGGGLGFRVRLAAMNPKGVVGRSEEFARLYAQMFADNVTAIADSLSAESDGKATVVMQEGEGCEGVFARARERNDHMLAKARHTACPNRMGGYCSPGNPACELYRDGRCLFDD